MLNQIHVWSPCSCLAALLVPSRFATLSPATTTSMHGNGPTAVAPSCAKRCGFVIRCMCSTFSRLIWYTPWTNGRSILSGLLYALWWTTWASTAEYLRRIATSLSWILPWRWWGGSTPCGSIVPERSWLLVASLCGASDQRCRAMLSGTSYDSHNQANQQRSHHQSISTFAVRQRCQLVNKPMETKSLIVWSRFWRQSDSTLMSNICFQFVPQITCCP